MPTQNEIILHVLSKRQVESMKGKLQVPIEDIGKTLFYEYIRISELRKK